MARGKRHMSHKEIMSKRKEKKQKKKKSPSSMKKYHFEEFFKLSKLEDATNKDMAMSIMEVVEEVKDNGMNDKRYMDIMNQLMVIHKKEETVADPDISIQIEPDISNDYAWDGNPDNDSFVGRTNLIRNIIRTDYISNRRYYSNRPRTLGNSNTYESFSRGNIQSRSQIPINIIHGPVVNSNRRYPISGLP